MPTFLREAHLKRQTVLDLLFRNLTRLAAFSVLALLVGIIIGSLIVGSMPAIHAFGFGFFTSPEWDPVNDQYGALIPIIGTLITSGIALLIAIPVSFRYRHLFDRTLPTLAAPPARHRRRIVGGHSQHHLRHVGLVCLCAVVWRLR